MPSNCSKSSNSPSERTDCYKLSFDILLPRHRKFGRQPGYAAKSHCNYVHAGNTRPRGIRSHRFSLSPVGQSATLA